MTSRDRDDQPTLDAAARIDELCNQFEEAWQTAGPPSLSDYLRGWEEPARSELLRELVQVDVYYRRKTGQPVEMGDYLSLDPASEDWLQQLLDDDPTRSIRDLAEETRDFSERRPAHDIALPSHADYVIESEIARGGMGRVLVGRELRLEREVAIKTLLPEADASRFVQEAKITARLQHPGIPPVYALGTLPDGSPFLAMKLVRGRTLADELAERSNPLEDLTHFLTVFEQIAQAVGFAHAQGIVHRDLKPANIMVGAFGEVHVMDWGLARDAQPESSPVQEGQSLGVEEIQRTRVGAVFGTPSYMPPEQARGEVVDARADVFALGGILATMLTSQPPFLGRTVRETLGQAADGDTKRIVDLLRNSGAEEELVEIAAFCLHADPIRRPMNGEEVAESIGNYRNHVEQRLRKAEADRAASEAKATEEKKRRKAIRVAAGLVIGVLAAGVIGTTIGLVNANVAWKAEKDAKNNLKIEYDRAELALKDVRSSINRYVDVVENEDLLRDPRFKQVIPKLLNEALGHYERYVEEYGKDQDAETRAEVAYAFERIGSIHRLSGNLYDALSAFELAQDIQQQLALEQPYDAEPTYVLAGLLLNAGAIGMETNQLEKAQDCTNECILLLSELQGRSDVSANECLELLASAQSNLGSIFAATNDPAKAVAAYSEAIVYRNQLLDHTSGAKEHLSGLARLHHNVATVHASNGDYEKAISAYEQSIALARQLRRDSSLSAEDQRSLAASLNDVGVLHQDLGVARLDLPTIEKAFGEFSEAIPIFEGLVADHPTVTEYQHGLASSYHNLGRWYSLTGGTDKAIEAHKKGIGHLEPIANDNRSAPKIRQSLATAYRNLGSCYRQHGQADNAFIAYAKAISILDQFYCEYPDLDEYRNDLALTCYNRGNALYSEERAAEAVFDYQRSILIWSQLKEEFPDIEDYRRRLSSAFTNVGLAYRATGKKALALESSLESIHILGQLVDANPELLDDAISLAGSCVNTAKSLREDLNDVAGSIDLFEKAIQLLNDTLSRDLSDDATPRLFLRNAYWGRAQSYEALAQWHLAKSDWESAFEFDQGSDRNFFQCQIARSLAQTSEHEAALSKAEEVLAGQVEGDPEVVDFDQYYAACAISLASNPAQDEQASSTSVRTMMQEQYASRALQILNTLDKMHFFDDPANRELLESTDLEPLRDIPEFQQLLQKLNGSE